MKIFTRNLKYVPTNDFAKVLKTLRAIFLFRWSADPEVKIKFVDLGHGILNLPLGWFGISDHGRDFEWTFCISNLNENTNLTRESKSARIDSGQ